MAITLANLKERLQECFAEAADIDSSLLQKRLVGFMEFAVANYDALDDEARAYVDRAFDGFQKAARLAAGAMRDGPDKRKFLRYLGLAEGRHFQAEKLLAILESPAKAIHPILPAAREAFVETLQRILDVLFDATRQTQKGGANVAKVGLCYWAIDELLVAFRLAQCALPNQSYAHIRTAQEIFDLVDLFNSQPDWARLWMTGEEKEVWASLKPSEVRKKLGKAKADPMYSFLSQHGPHGTFRGLRARSAQIAREGPDERTSFKIWVGGSPLVSHIVWTHALCIYAATVLLATCVGIFSDSLDAVEMESFLEKSDEASRKFFREHFVGWVKDQGLDYEPLLDFLSNPPWKKS